MRRALMTALALFFLAGVLTQPAKAALSFDLYYSRLSPHGSWHLSADYGQVWQPGVATAGWNPYYDGHWVYTDLGWSWVSDYAWGALPYHYGTWVVDRRLGWVWVPGYVWAPSWVVFCSDSDFIGWAPVPPGYSVGARIRIGELGPDRFVFTPAREFLSPRIRRHVAPGSRTRRIVDNARLVNNISVRDGIVVNRGPDVRVVERATGRRIRAVPIERVSRAAHGPRLVREQLRVEPGRDRRSLRATEPKGAGTPPAPRQKEKKKGGTKQRPRDNKHNGD